MPGIAPGWIGERAVKISELDLVVLASARRMVDEHYIGLIEARHARC
jgi:predicted SAM-dependent methyltransferase